ncbi:MAG TPA: response regulator [Gaiellaceae bacterium]|nr:response regulator [Gaiellaceae bacterium]
MEEVTFLFTDIERSTSLLERLGERYVALLERHREVLADAVAAAGGRVVDCRGDDLFAVFPTAAGGMRAAVHAQRELTAASWAAGAGLRVRMGLHSGRAQSAGDGYVGLAVHHASRVAQTAHGGEILASEKAVVAAGEVAGVTATDLGEFELRGIPRPTRLFRVAAPGVERDFAPPRAQASRPAPTRVALADDSVLLREGIAAILEEDGFDVVGQAGTADDLLDLVEATLPDVAIVDIRMPPTKTDEGIRAAAEIQRRHPRTGVLLLSQHVDVENAVQLFAGEPSGIGYLLKDRVADVDDFLGAVRRVAGGGTALDASIVEECRSGLWPDDAHAAIVAAAARAAVVGYGPA